MGVGVGAGKDREGLGIGNGTEVRGARESGLAGLTQPAPRVRDAAPKMAKPLLRIVDPQDEPTQFSLFTV